MKIKIHILRDWGTDSQKGENAHHRKEKSHWWVDQAKLGSITNEGKGSGLRQQPGGTSMYVISVFITNQLLFLHSGFTEEEETWTLEVPLGSVRDRSVTRQQHSPCMPGTVLGSNPLHLHTGPHFTGENIEAHRRSATRSSY